MSKIKDEAQAMIINKNGGLIIKNGQPAYGKQIIGKNIDIPTAISYMEIRPYAYFRLTKDLQNIPAIINAAIIGFDELLPTVDEHEQKVIGYIRGSLNAKLEKLSVSIDRRARRM